MRARTEADFFGREKLREISWIRVAICGSAIKDSNPWNKFSKYGAGRRLTQQAVTNKSTLSLLFKSSDKLQSISWAKASLKISTQIEGRTNGSDRNLSGLDSIWKRGCSKRSYEFRLLKKYSSSWNPRVFLGSGNSDRRWYKMANLLVSLPRDRRLPNASLRSGRSNRVFYCRTAWQALSDLSGWFWRPS